MRKWRVVAVALTLILGAGAVLAADDSAEWNWFGSLRFRPENQNNFSDTWNDRDDNIAFTSYRANFGFQVDLEQDVSVLFDIQALGVWGEDQTPLRGYHTYSNTEATTGLYRAYVEVRNIFGSPLNLRLGRQPLVVADEFLLGDLDFYGGTSWDALRADYTLDWGSITAFIGKAGEVDRPELVYQVYTEDPDTGDLIVTEGDEGGDANLYGLNAMWKISDTMVLDGALLYWFDHRGFPIPGFNSQDKRWTYWAHFAYEPETGPYGVANLAIQDGDTIGWTEEDGLTMVGIGRPMAWEATGGWKWDRAGKPAKVWLRLAQYSGDDPESEDVESFNPLAQDFHGRYGFMDLWNGLNRVPYIGGPSGANVIQLGFDTQITENFRLAGIAEYMKANEKYNNANCRGLGKEFGFSGTYDYSKNFSFEVGLAQAYPGTAMGQEPPFGRPTLGAQDTIRRVYVNTAVRF